MNLIDRLVTLLRINELEGKFYWHIRELAVELSDGDTKYSPAEIARFCKSLKYFSLMFVGRNVYVQLNDAGRVLADRLLDIDKEPIDIRVRNRDPWLVDLTVMYRSPHFRACRRHHIYIEPFFLRKNRLVEPEEADDVLGVIKCTDRDKKERVPLRLLRGDNVPERIGLLFMYCLGRYEEFVEKDSDLARVLLHIVRIRRVLGAIVKKDKIVWGGRIIDLKFL